MRIEDGKIKPCSTCLKVRQAAKTAAGKVMRRPRPPHSSVELSTGDKIVIRNSDHTIVEAGNSALVEYLGRRVYLAGSSVIDVETAKPIKAMGSIVKVLAIW